MSTDNIPNTPPALFSSFLMSLASAALIEMGAMEDPVTKTSKKNKDSAAQHVDLLLVMREKTKGNLEVPEKELLDKIISDLQLEFAKSFKEK